MSAAEERREVRELLAALAALGIATAGSPAAVRQIEQDGGLAPGMAEKIVTASGITEAPEVLEWRELASQMKHPNGRGFRAVDPLLDPASRAPRPGPPQPDGSQFWGKFPEHDARVLAASEADQEQALSQVLAERGDAWHAARREAAAAQQATGMSQVDPGGMGRAVSTPTLAEAAAKRPGHRRLAEAAAAEADTAKRRNGTPAAPEGILTDPFSGPLSGDQIFAERHAELEAQPVIGSAAERGLVQPPGTESASRR